MAALSLVLLAGAGPAIAQVCSVDEDCDCGFECISGECVFVQSCVQCSSDVGAPTCPGDVQVTAAPGALSAVVTFPNATPPQGPACGFITVVCSPPSGSSFPVGTTQVTCTATDTGSATPSQASCSFLVEVQEAPAAPALSAAGLGALIVLVAAIGGAMLLRRTTA